MYHDMELDENVFDDEYWRMKNERKRNEDMARPVSVDRRYDYGSHHRTKAKEQEPKDR
tara:strand:+ start:96 stop:269 length:174 start_codon:yes stop_codon:yes gene_type:complete